MAYLVGRDGKPVVSGSDFTAKGDLLVGTGVGAFGVRPVGAAGEFLTADPATSTGLNWVTAAGEIVLTGTTIDATPTELFIDGVPNARLSVPENSSLNLVLRVVGRNTASLETSGHDLEVVIHRGVGVGTTAVVGNEFKITVARSAAGDVAVSADTVNGALKVEVTGEAGKTIDWEARVLKVEVVGVAPPSLAFANYIGDGTSNRSIVVSNFLPTFAFVSNSDAGGIGGVPYVKTTDMADGSSYGITPQLLNTGRIDILEATGIRIDSDADVNAVGVNYDVVIARNTSSGVNIFSYVGDGANDRDIIGVGFDPEWVIVVQVSASNNAHIKAPNFAALTSADWASGAASVVRIKTLITDGFRVGTSSKVNTIGETYQAICFKGFVNGNGKVKVLQYVGDGVDNRALVGVGFQPRFVLIQIVGEQGGHKTEGMGAFSKRHQTPTFDVTMIKSFDADGFTIGTHPSVNDIGENVSALCLSD